MPRSSSFTISSLNEEDNTEVTITTRPTCITTIGLPGCGKSSWAKSFREHAAEMSYILSFDDQLAHAQMMTLPTDEWGDPLNPRRGGPRSEALSYQGKFDKFKDVADARLHAMAIGMAVPNRKGIRVDVIVDSTNITKAKRGLIRDVYFPVNLYDHVAVVFKSPSWEELCEINNERSSRDRSIAPEVLKLMYDTYQNESKDFLTSEEAKLYTKVLVPSFQSITSDGRFYD